MTWRCESLLSAYLCLSSFLFFFSSRRRHTRFDCDWSSDVCSSDLADNGVGGTVQASTGARIINLSLGGPRSEEHTSELQSQSNLVCRLLLEKKKKKQTSEFSTSNSSDVGLSSTFQTA